MPKAFNEDERRRIRDRLIAAGKRLINRAGTKALTVDEAAREAGISKGSFYSFFPSREDFILSVFESWEEQYRGALLGDLLGGEGELRGRLERFFKGSFAILQREPGLAKLGYGEIERIKEALPAERLAAHQAADAAALEGAAAAWLGKGAGDPGLLAALPGLGAALFAIAIHKDDFPGGSFEPATALIAESLAMRLSAAEGGEGRAKEGS